MGKFIDLTGQEFEFLTVIRRDGYDNRFDDTGCYWFWREGDEYPKHMELGKVVSFNDRFYAKDLIKPCWRVRKLEE